MRVSYPVALRDRLYDLFVECAAKKDGARAFEKQASGLQLSGAEAAYRDDRLPRYVSTLAGASVSRIADSYARSLETAELLFNHGLFFDAHEYLEGVWKSAVGARKTFVQGLIQIAAAFHKLELDPDGIAGAHYLLARGLDKAPALAGTLRPALKELTAGRVPEAPAVSFQQP
jgi:hypothetical protein